VLVEVNQHRFTIVLPTDFASLPLELWHALRQRGPVTVAVPASQMIHAEPTLAQYVEHVIPIEERSWVPIGTTVAGALDRMDAHPFETVVITDSNEFLAEAIPTRVGTIFVGIPNLEILPDDHVETWATLTATTRVPGWFGELALSDVRPGTAIARAGTFLIVDKSTDLPGVATARVIILGRSFPRSDARCDKHQYSQRILRLKGNGDIDRFARGLSALLEWIKAENSVDVITRVPPRADHEDPLGSVALATSRLTHVPYDPDLLVRVREYIPQKEIGDYENRRANVQGAFRGKELTHGTRVVLIDDIYTSGSTVLECARTLAVNGAQHVDIAVFGKNQHFITPSIDSALKCDTCGAPMRLRISSNNKAYWRCTDWQGCGSRTYYDKGLRAANELNVRPSARAEDIDF
jgi:Phosphoribosyl transferase domain